MDDAMRKFLQEADSITKLAKDLDLSQKLSLSAAAAEAMKGLSAAGALKDVALPRVMEVEHYRMPKIPTPEESNTYQSSGVLLQRLADSITQWRNQLPENVQPAILAVLHGGIQIEVERLAQESFHGIRIEGRLQGSPCVVLSHQSTVQLLCFVQPVQPPERPRRPIGFVIDGKAWEA